MGIWINTDTVDLDAAPTFYAVATSGPLDRVLTNTEDLRHRVSIPRAIRSTSCGKGSKRTILQLKLEGTTVSFSTVSMHV